MTSAALKAINQAIKQEDYEKAEKDIQTLDKANNTNILIYLFGIVVSNKLNKENSAVYYLQKAKDLDPKNPEVIKAECAVYEKFPHLINKKNVGILNNVINDEKTPDERKTSLKKLKLLSYLRLRMFVDFLSDKDLEEGLNEFEICELILKVAKSGEKIPVEISKKAYLNAKNELKQQESIFGLFLFQTEDENYFTNLVFEHVLKFGCDDQLVFKAAYSSLTLSLINEQKIPKKYEEIIKNEKFYPKNEKISDWLKSLLNNEISQAYDKLLNLTIDKYSTWPLCGLALYTFLSTRQFNRVLTLYRMKKNVFKTVGNENIFRTMEIESSYENYGDISELRQLVRNLEKTKEYINNDRILEIYLKMKILIDNINENDILSTNLSGIIKYELLGEYYYLKNDYKKSLNEVNKVLSINNENRWKSKLIKLKIEWKTTDNIDDIIDNVRELYGKYPFVADILVLLAEIYYDIDELQYAKQIIDHAVKVTPSRQIFRELQDKIYAKMNIPIEERIENLNAYVSMKPYCMWAVRHSTVLEIQNGRFDEAVSKLKRVIHAIPDDVDVEVKTSAAGIWGYVGLVNFHRGQYLSTMYAFESAVSLDENNPNYLFLLALSQRNIYHFDKVFATLKKLRTVESSLIIKKLAHELFLETIILYSIELKPGKEQVYQLITFFKIIGNMKTSDWISSKVLSYSIAISLSLLRKYNTTIIDSILLEVSIFSKKFGIFDKETAFDAEIAIMLSLLTNDDHYGILNEAGLRILDYSFEKNSTKYSIIARKFFKKAILSPKNDDNIYKSYLFVNLSLTYCIGKIDYKKAIHCVLRSLQLFKNNATALSLLGFLMIGTDNFESAKNAFNNAHILEPEQMNHWCGRAILGELNGYLTEDEIMNNYQHSLSIRPCRQAVESFVCRLIEEKSKKGNISRNIFFDYKSLSHLSYLFEKDDEISYSLAIIAEHFRHFNEAAYLIEQLPSTSNIPGLELAKQRIFAATRKDGSMIISLKRLEQIYHNNLYESIVSSGEKLTNLIKFLLSSLGADDWRIFWKFYKSKFYPLLISLLNILNISSNWGKGIHSTIREGRPQHKLLEVFPYITPKNEYPATRRPKEDENAFIRYDPGIEPLYELFRKLKEEYESTDEFKTKSEDDFPVVLPVEDEDIPDEIDDD